MEVSPTKSKDQFCKHMWRRKETFLGYSCLQKALSRSVKRTWGQGQNICCPHTQSPHENWGVNPVSNRLGLTLINPTTIAANATTQKEIPGLLTFICACAQTINLAYTHRKNTCTQTYSVYIQNRGFHCVICLAFPTFQQLCLWSGSNVDSWRPVP